MSRLTHSAEKYVHILHLIFIANGQRKHAQYVQNANVLRSNASDEN